MKFLSRDSLLSISIIIAALIIGGSIILGAGIIAKSSKGKDSDILIKTIFELGKQLQEKNTISPRAPMAEPKRPDIGSRKVEGVGVGTNQLKGDVKAPVLMVEFSDLQCPFSKRFNEQVFPLIEKEYISKGKVKFAFRDYTLAFHAQAKPAAIAARCAGKQGKYWQMFDKIISGGVFDNDSFKKYAKELGLNMKAYEDCQNAKECTEAMEADIKDAEKFGISGTPGFFINGRFVNGAVPFEVFKKIIDEELAKPASKG